MSECEFVERCHYLRAIKGEKNIRETFHYLTWCLDKKEMCGLRRSFAESVFTEMRG